MGFVSLLYHSRRSSGDCCLLRMSVVTEDGRMSGYVWCLCCTEPQQKNTRFRLETGARSCVSSIFVIIPFSTLVIHRRSSNSNKNKSSHQHRPILTIIRIRNRNNKRIRIRINLPKKINRPRTRTDTRYTHTNDTAEYQHKTA